MCHLFLYILCFPAFMTADLFPLSLISLSSQMQSVFLYTVPVCLRTSALSHVFRFLLYFSETLHVLGYLDRRLLHDLFVCLTAFSGFDLCLLHLNCFAFVSAFGSLP